MTVNVGQSPRDEEIPRGSSNVLLQKDVENPIDGSSRPQESLKGDSRKKY